MVQGQLHFLTVIKVLEDFLKTEARTIHKKLTHTVVLPNKDSVRPRNVIRILAFSFNP